MNPTTHIGYGPFHLGDFEPGELWARFDGSLAKVCDPQPTGRPDHVYVWINYGTSNAERTWLHRTAQAFATCEEAAWIIERLRKGDSHAE